jgi:hypothetical protein
MVPSAGICGDRLRSIVPSDAQIKMHRRARESKREQERARESKREREREREREYSTIRH